MNKFKKRTISLLLTVSMIASLVLCLPLDTAAQVKEEDTTQASQPRESLNQPIIVTQPATEISSAVETNSVIATEMTESTDSIIETQAQTEPQTQAVPSVNKVNKIVSTTNASNYITISWDKVENACGYIVYYRNCDKTKTLTKLTITKDTSVTVRNLTDSTHYQFKVTAFETANGKVYEGEPAYLESVTKPASLGSLVLRRSSSIVEIGWSKNSRASKYEIYRMYYKTNGKYVKYKTISNNTTIFTDKNVEQGRAYYYQIRAIRTVNNKTYYGPFSTLRTVAGLAAPSGKTVTTQLNRVSLTWNKNKYAHGYDIYYANSAKGPFKLLKTTANTYFNTTRIATGTKCYFRIAPYRNVGKYKISGTWVSASATVTNKAYGKNIGNTYIEISIKQQRMWFYIGGKLYTETAVVTGNNDGYHNTPKGCYKIFQRQSPATLVGPGYRSYVKYWLGFTSSGVGIHDASWRSSREYGGTTYQGNGSHGCVNTPYSAVKKIYQKAKIGTYVVVY